MRRCDEKIESNGCRRVIQSYFRKATEHGRQARCIVTADEALKCGEDLAVRYALVGRQF